MSPLAIALVDVVSGQSWSEALKEIEALHERYGYYQVILYWWSTREPGSPGRLVYETMKAGV